MNPDNQNDSDCTLPEMGGCTLAREARGDCEHFVGLPGKSIPGQHDGPDDTVDVYGKPNGWCWSCWKSHQIVALRKERDELIACIHRSSGDINQLEADLANVRIERQQYKELWQKEQAKCAAMRHVAEFGWTVIANASNGDWTKETVEWRDAAARFRAMWHNVLSSDSVK